MNIITILLWICISVIFYIFFMLLLKNYCPCCFIYNSNTNNNNDNIELPNIRNAEVINIKVAEEITNV